MQVDKKGESIQIVQSVQRALLILETIVNSDGSLGITEISNMVNLHKSTVHRLVSTLEHNGYILQDSRDSKYKVGIKLFELGTLAANKLDVRREVRPLLEELMYITKETVHLGVIDKNEVVYIDKVQSNQTIMYSKVGLRAPVHCTGLGKVLLAYSSNEALDNFLKNGPFKRYTEQTITDSKELGKHLKLIKKQGYAIDDIEHEENIRCIAAPIFDCKGQVIASFSVTGPTIRMTKEKVNSLIDLIKDYSKKMSKLMGYTDAAY